MGVEGYYALVLVMLIRVALEYMRTGAVNLVGLMLLIVGWVIGYLLVRLEPYLARWAVDPGKSPFRNVLTGGIIAILAVWVVSSSGTMLGIGVVTGVAVRLYADMLNDKNPKRWYWIFAREFSDKEQKIIKIVWGVVVGLALVMLV